MTVDKDAPLETVWQGKYISALKRGRWEYVSRTGSVNAVVIIAEHFPRSSTDTNEIPDKLIEL